MIVAYGFQPLLQMEQKRWVMSRTLADGRAGLSFTRIEDKSKLLTPYLFSRYVLDET